MTAATTSDGFAAPRVTLRDAIARARTEIVLGKLDDAEDLLLVLTTAYPLVRAPWELLRDLYRKRNQLAGVEVIEHFLAEEEVPWQ